MKEINEKIEELGLPFVMDKLTHSHGNCFFVLSGSKLTVLELDMMWFGSAIVTLI